MTILPFYLLIGYKGVEKRLNGLNKNQKSGLILYLWDSFAALSFQVGIAIAAVPLPPLLSRHEIGSGVLRFFRLEPNHASQGSKVRVRSLKAGMLH